MKFILYLLLVVLISTTTAQSDVLNDCQLTNTITLRCSSFKHSYLPYKEDFKQAEVIYVSGDFNELVIDAGYSNLTTIGIYSPYLQRFQLQDYTDFANIKSIEASYSVQELKVNFTGADKMERLTSLKFKGNKNLGYSCENLRSSNLHSLFLYENMLETFDFRCLPLTLNRLVLRGNRISSLRSFDSLKTLSSLENLNFDGHSMKRLDFTDIPHSMKYLYIENSQISELTTCEALKNIPNLIQFSLRGNMLNSFNFTCLPDSLYNLVLTDNQLSAISNESCAFLRTHPRLSYIYLNSNQLKEFDFKCLPSNGRMMVNLGDNSISAFHLLNAPRPLSLAIYGNPIQCTCSFLRDYVQLIDSNNVTFFSSSGEYVSCGNADSQLTGYPWITNSTVIKLHDASAIGCFNGGEDDDGPDQLNQVFRIILSHIIRFFSHFF